MRALRIVGWAACGIASVIILLFVVLQTAAGQRALATLASSLASSADSKVEIAGLAGFFPTNLSVERVTLADRQGPWLQADDARLQWSFASLFSGRVRIDLLSARRVDAMRAPQSKGTASPSSDGGFGLPIGIDIRALAVDDVHVGAALAAGVDSRWKLAGSGLLAAKGQQSRLKLELARTDGASGRASADLVFDLDPLKVDGQVEVDEHGPNGVIAALLGRPDLDQVSARLVAKGDRDNGAAELTAAAQDALRSNGKLDWHRANDATDLTLGLEVAGPGLPDGPYARLIRSPARLQARANFSDDRLLRLSEASLAVGAATLKASGTYDTRADKLDVDTILDAGSADSFAGLVDGVGWSRLHLQAKVMFSRVTGEPQGTVDLSGSADDFAMPSLGERAPAPMRVDLAAKLARQADGQLTLVSLDLASPLTAIRGSGAYRPTARTGQAKLAIDGTDLGALSSLAGTELKGRTHLELDLSATREGVAMTWRGTVDELSVANVPTSFSQAQLRLSGRGRYKPDGAWQVEGARVESDRATFEFGGHGLNDSGELSLAVSLPQLQLLQPEVSGSAAIKASVAYDASEVRGSVSANGTVADQTLSLAGRFSRKEDGSLEVPALQGSWASATVDVRDLKVTREGATGAGRLTMSRLEELQPVLGVEVGGSLDLDIGTEPDPAGKIRLTAHGDRLRGQGIVAANLQVQGTVVDPLGKGDADATVKVSGMSGTGGLSQVNATVKGDRQNLNITLDTSGQGITASLMARVETTSNEIRVALQRLNGRYRDIPVGLGTPTTITITGSNTAIQNATLSVGGGRVAVSGNVDAANSRLAIQISQLPLALIEAFAPSTRVEGVLQAKIDVSGPLAEPRIQATYSASGLRLRRAETALVPALALQGSASLVRQQASYDATISAGGATRLQLKGEATLPQGNVALRARVALQGNMDLAPFAPALGNSLRGVAGTLRPDLVLTMNGQAISGTGTIVLSGGAGFMPDTGLRLSNGQGTIVLAGDTLQLQRLSFQTSRNGEVSATGSVRLSPDLPVDLAVSMRNALLVNRPDLVAEVSSNIKVTGSPANSLDVQGPVTINRAEIAIGVSQAANFPVLPVTEINGRSPTDAYVPQPPASGASGNGGTSNVRLNLTIQAPQAIFVRGRGLNAEIGGQFTVTGNPSHPAVLGSLTLRRGTLNLAGRALQFTRGNVSLVSATTIDPLLDFAATTNVQSTTIEVDITGTARAPKISLTSSPVLPQDEAMALLLFGKPSTSLSPGEILMAAQAVSELSGGAPVGSGFFGRIRSVLGLDQLSVGSSSSSTSGSSGAAGTTLQGGRYVAPGVYVGAEQGTTASSTRGVVNIDVFDNTKIEGAIGTDSNDRIGVKMEWDY
jgi:translocation and assembly module TamB